MLQKKTTSKHEEIVMETIQSETQRFKRTEKKKKKEQSINGMLNNNKFALTHVQMESRKWEREEKLFEKIVTNNFPNLMITINPQI